MVTNNKVLTVSYGTFSCTLEGFDDSFDTMKSIAEYFRDLAADDRYFGAEPPTPDAEMLARIAEREIARQVVAHQDQGTIHLRAAEMAQTAQPAPAVAAPAAPAAAPIAVSSASADTQVAEPEAAPEPEVIEATPTESTAPAQPSSDDESVANKLQRIRAVVSRNAEAAAPIAQAFEDEHTTEAPANAAADETAEEVAETEQPYSEDEHAEDVVVQPNGDAAPEAASVAEGIAADADSNDDGQDDQDSDMDPVALAALAGLATTDDSADVNTDATAEETEIEVSDAIAEEAEDDFGAILAAVRNAETDAQAQDVAEDTAMPEPQQDEMVEDTILDLPDDAFDMAAEAEHDQEPVQPVRPVRPVRVVKMKRADYEAGLLAGAAQPEGQPADHSAIHDAQDPSALSAEEEADLLRELSEVEADTADTAEQYLEPGEVRSIFADEAEDADVERLMDKTVSEMDDPEGTHRRNAIAHLRAAVLANRAETDAGGALANRETGSHAYREDLNDVVRPSRAEAAAPLKLVAEQRIDTATETATVMDTAAEAAPVRPRRVRRIVPAAEAVATDMAVDMAADNIPAPDTAIAAETETASPAAFGSFAEFAETVGAQELPDLLEAAASYLSHVEGLDQFSRPQLMKQAREVDTLEFSREDGLRSFGQLLRDGKIEKLQGGRFTVSDHIGFKPVARAAG